MLPPQLLVARYLDSNIPGTASQVCILLWVEFPWIFPGPGVTNEGWQQLISYQINDRQAFQLLHSPHSLSTSGPSLMFLTGMMEMICMLHSDWHHYTEMVSTRTQQTNKMLACDAGLSRITVWRFVTNAPPRVASFLGIFPQFHWEPGSGCWC